MCVPTQHYDITGDGDGHGHRLTVQGRAGVPLRQTQAVCTVLRIFILQCVSEHVHEEEHRHEIMEEKVEEVCAVWCCNESDQVLLRGE